MSKRKKLTLILGSCVLLVGVVSCALLYATVGCFGACKTPLLQAHKTYVYTPPTHKGGTLLFSTPYFPDSTNPWFPNQTVDVEIAPALWGSPIVAGPDGTWLPDELTEVPTQANGDVSREGMTCLLKLRPDLKWSDGQPLTADDFVYWLQVLLDRDTGASSTFGFDQLASYSAQDAHTVRLQYKQPFGPYLSYLPYAAPRHAWGQIAHNALANTQEVNLSPKVTSGPFVVTDFASAQSITMTPNRFYTSTTLHGTVLDRLIYKAYQDRTALSEGFQAGETDYADEFKAEDIQPLSAVPGVHLAQAGAYELLDFNLAHPWLQDVHVRRAIALAIDRCKLVQVLILQSCEKYVGKSVVLPPSPDVDPTIKGFPFDLKQARAEMQAAGYDCSSGTCLRDGQPFPALHLATRQNDLQDRELAELLTQDLTTLGLPTSVDFYPPNILFAPYDYNGILATGQYDLMRFATTVPLDSDPNLYPLYHSSQIPSAANPGGGNWERVQDTELDRLFDTGRTTLDPAKRAAIYRQVQQIIVMRQVYTIALFEIPNMSLVSPNIGNFFDNPTQFLNQWNIGEWYLKSAGG